MKVIVPISFGKDSTTLADKMLGSGMQVDYLIFTDTLMEFPMMYDYAEKVKSYFQRKYDREIIVLKPLTTFEEWCFGVIRDKTSERYGYIRGIPPKTGGVCFWRRESKEKPMQKWIKENIQDNDYLMAIGYTSGEESRIRGKKFKERVKDREGNDTKEYKYSIDYVLEQKLIEDKQFYPLFEDFNMSEGDCKNYLIFEDMENPLYRHFSRTGCAMCPFQSDKSYMEIYNNFRDVWDYMRFIESRLEYYEKMGYKIVNKHWRDNFRTLKEMEDLFNSSFNFNVSDEPLKDCFCKI